MRLVYDPEVDVLSVLLSDAPVAESDQDKAGYILDYDASGNMVGFEILDASKRMANPMSVEYAVTPPLRRPA
jgi:YD repeat-containing protein